MGTQNLAFKKVKCIQRDLMIHYQAQGVCVCVCVYTQNTLTTSSVGQVLQKQKGKRRYLPLFLSSYRPTQPQLRQVPCPATLFLESSFLNTSSQIFPHSFHSSRTHSWVQSLHHHPQFEKKKKSILNLNYTAPN